MSQEASAQLRNQWNDSFRFAPKTAFGLAQEGGRYRFRISNILSSARRFARRPVAGSVTPSVARSLARSLVGWMSFIPDSRIMDAYDRIHLVCAYRHSECISVHVLYVHPGCRGSYLDDTPDDTRIRRVQL